MISPSSTPHLDKPSKAPEKISGMFNRIAKTYDLLNDCMTGGMHRLWKIKACRTLQLTPGDSVLDVCTGTGDLAKMLSEIVGESGQVTGLDFSEAMLDVAQQKYCKIENINWVQGDALALPFADNTFNGAIISFGLRNVQSVPTALSEMARVVKPGGWIVNLDTASDCHNPLFWFYFSNIMPILGQLFSQDRQAYHYLCQSTKTFETPSNIASILQEAGLKEVSIDYLGLNSVSIQAGHKLP